MLSVVDVEVEAVGEDEDWGGGVEGEVDGEVDVEDGDVDAEDVETEDKGDSWRYK